ncbi:hypothetical protein T12_2486 [Trichinella patagoniensis]|uniref:Uncharacterized protein n=1 Tax=Trichinella patagoniensis TaxID=990121 RepID=A0A0V0ZTD1_9BILA|nr:hypothetical protein T12_2486 [Trichinella patagoniensis]
MTTQNFGANNTGDKLSCKEIKIERSNDEINRKLSTSQQFSKVCGKIFSKESQNVLATFASNMPLPRKNGKNETLARDKCQRYKWCSGTGANIDNNCSAKAKRASRSIG